MLWQSEQRFVGVIDGRVAVRMAVRMAAVVSPRGATIMVVGGSVLIKAPDFGVPLSVGRDLAQRVM